MIVIVVYLGPWQICAYGPVFIYVWKIYLQVEEPV